MVFCTERRGYKLRMGFEAHKTVRKVINKIWDGKGKGKLHPRTGHEGPEGE